ncbi:FMN-dependent NADH-azoreductase [Pseudomaricurvus sp.]|uniref:FMN-dependent NADH-azoreductase n=1 Tax=Pseudomaricurvus sp. TaxID=2004510 RepID=UPI003F6C19F9
MTVLKIDSSARLEGSNSRQLTDYLVEQLADSEVVVRDLVRQPLPLVSAEDLMGVHGSSDDQRESLQQHLALSETLIAELKEADTLVLGVSMYNFGIPAVLKQWIDYVCRAGVTFRYGANGPEGLTGIKRAYIVTATGGTPVGSPMDFASGYLEWVCKFLGVEEITHIDASGSKGTPEQVIAGGQQQIDQALAETVATA